MLQPPDLPPLILNVEDNATARAAVSELLSREGFDVREASSGEEALARMDCKPDIILLDINLGPGMDGLEVCRRLKAAPLTATIPLILISSLLVQREDRIRGLEDGADGYLTKPVDPTEMVAHIKALLRVRRAEKAQRQSEQRFRAAFEHAAVGMAIADLNGRYVEVNATFCRIVGYDREELLSVRIQSITHPDDWPQNAKKVRDLLAGKVPSFLIEKRYLRKDGGVVWVKNSVSVLRDDEGKPVHLIALAEDITDRKQAEEAYRASESRLRAIIEKSFDCISLIATDGTILYTSPASVSVLGYTPEENIGRNAFELLHPDDFQRVQEQFERLVHNPGRSLTSLHRGRHKDGSWRWLEARGTNLLHEPSVQALVINFRDITEQRQAQEQLRQAQKMEAIGRLAGGVAHDFNNLLCIINGYSDLLLQETNLHDPGREMLAQIRKAGELSASLTRQLLVFSRQQAFAPKQLNLNVIIANIEKMLRRVIGEDVKLVTRLAAGVGSIEADPGQMEQVVMNLAVNARDAMPAGGTLAIETEDDPVGRSVVLLVADTGCGMTSEVKSRLFEPFFTTKEPGKGTGLGLATVYGIVKQSGGDIEVESEPGCGTRFRIRFPYAEKRPGGSPSQHDTRPSVPGHETILVVEDEEAVRSLTTLVLRQAGYQVLEACDGETALRTAEAHEGVIDLLVTDVVMPGLGGRQVAEKLLQQRPELRVLFLSGYSDDRVIREGLLHDKVMFLRKPFTPAGLSQKVREVLDVPCGSAW